MCEIIIFSSLLLRLDVLSSISALQHVSLVCPGRHIRKSFHRQHATHPCHKITMHSFKKLHFQTFTFEAYVPRNYDMSHCPSVSWLGYLLRMQRSTFIVQSARNRCQILTKCCRIGARFRPHAWQLSTHWNQVFLFSRFERMSFVFACGFPLFEAWMTLIGIAHHRFYDFAQVAWDVKISLKVYILI